MPTTYKKLITTLLVSLAPMTLHAYSYGWFDSVGDQQLFDSSRTVFKAEAAEDYGQYLTNGRTDGRSADLKGNGSYFQLGLTWPETRGSVTIRLKKVAILFREKTSAYTRTFAIDTTTSADPNTTEWTRTNFTVTVNANTKSYQTFTLPSPQECKQIRIVNTQSGFMQMWEADFLGDTVNDTAAADFATPGNLVTGPMLDLLKERINNNTHPAGVTLSYLQSTSRWPATNVTPQAVQNVGSGAAGEVALSNDGQRAYMNAVMWWIRRGTNDTEASTYANNAKNILNAWATTHTQWSVDRSGASLTSGLEHSGYIYAADILRSGGFSGWDATVDSNFRNYMNRVASLVWERDLSDDNNHGNWSMAVRRTALAWSIFLKNRYQFNRLVELHKRQLDQLTSSAPWGEVQETCRDLAHARMYMSGAAATCEIAWNQGIDLYSWGVAQDSVKNGLTWTVNNLPSVGGTRQVTLNDAPSMGSRMANIYEYHTKAQRVGGAAITPLPQNIRPEKHPNWQGVISNTENSATPIGADGGNGTFNGWGYETIFNHYRNRLGIAMPELQLRVNHMRANNRRDEWIHGNGWGTITHVDVGDPGTPPPPPPDPVVVALYDFESAQEPGDRSYAAPSKVAVLGATASDLVLSTSIRSGGGSNYTGIYDNASNYGKTGDGMTLGGLIVNTSSVTSTLDLNKHAEFTITPATGRTLSLTSLKLDYRKSNTGDTYTLKIRSSLDNFAVDLLSHNLADSTAWFPLELDLTTIPAAANLTVPVSFRIYFTDSSGSTNRTHRIDNIIVSGIIPAGTGPTAGFSSWIAGFQDTVGTQTGFEDDPDLDGFANGIESVLGTNPGESSSRPEIILSSISPVEHSISHPLAESISPDVDWEFEWSTDLATWFKSGASNGQTTVTFDAPATTSEPELKVSGFHITGVTPTQVFVRIHAAQVTAGGTVNQ